MSFVIFCIDSSSIAMQMVRDGGCVRADFRVRCPSGAIPRGNGTNLNGTRSCPGPARTRRLTCTRQPVTPGAMRRGRCPADTDSRANLTGTARKRPAVHEGLLCARSFLREFHDSFVNVVRRPKGRRRALRDIAIARTYRPRRARAPERAVFDQFRAPTNSPSRKLREHNPYESCAYEIIRGAEHVRIRFIEPLWVRLPMRRPMHMAGVDVGVADNVLVRIVADSGETGWGEAASAPTMTGETPEGMVAAVRHLAPFLTGMHAEDFEALDREMSRRLHGNPGARAAIDIALLDLVARHRNVPVHALLGPVKRTRVPVLWMLGTGALEGDVAEARQKRDAGCVAFKVKVGVAGPREDAVRTLAICEAVGDGCLVSADANQGFGVEQAIAYVHAVAGSTLAFLEQPVAAEDLPGMVAVAAASRLPVGADEGLHGVDDIRRHHAAGAAAGGSLKTIKFGGVRAVFRAGLVCEELGMRVNLACKVAESSVAAAAVMHLAAALPGLAWGVSLSNQYLTEDLVSDPVTVVAGHARVPEGPGLGVTVDEDRVRALRR
ncbi:MAG: hypothetical protein GC151_14830 [Betaproteobacteria bacterium]|nr:hypothetical protein [Betaproteobacteria bacterium]